MAAMIYMTSEMISESTSTADLLTKMADHVVVSSDVSIPA